jgi:hypothetical protein
VDDLTKQLMQQLSGDGVSRISRKIRADEQTTNAALTTAMPLLLSALAKNASQPGGAQSLYQALAEDHDGSILNDVPGFLNDPQAANGAGILKHVLGSQQPVVAKGLAQGTGLKSSQIKQLLRIVAPLLMGMLGQQQQQQGLDTNGLSALLGNQQQMAQETNPDMMSVLNSLLDTDRDGSALDEVMGMVGKLFGGQ